MAKKRQGKVQAFSPSNAQVEQYTRQIRGVSREVSRICSPLTMRSYSESELLEQMGKVLNALDRYAEIVEPWAEVVAERLMLDLGERNLKLWKASSRAISRQIATGFGDPMMRTTLNDQIARNVAKIKGIPIDARARIERLVGKGQAEGRRADDIARDLMATGKISENRAMLIARTELSKASTEITRIRAVDFGSPGYIWRTSEDRAVRDSHAEMEGKVVAWDNPPELDGMVGHAGEFPNCRCYPEVIIPAEDESVSERMMEAWVA